MKTYKTITKEKGLDIIGYQNQFFGKKIWEQSPNPLVLAAGTSAGKTITTLIALEIFYSDKKNYNKRSLFIPASKTVLRNNVRTAIEEFNPSFGYYVATNKKELEEAINDKSYQVIIALPQTLNNNYSLLPNIHNFILDEAHQWYFKTTITKIIKHINPTKQLLLTGTPSRFIAKEDKFDFFFVPVMDLYDEKRVSNIKVEVVSSSYDFKQNDYLSNYGNLKSNKTNSDTKTKQAFTMVCEEMILKLRSQLGSKYLTNVRGANKIASMFNDLDKTIIFCHSLKQSNAIYKQLNSMKGLKDKVLISHSENDSDSEYFEMFRTDDNYKVLVAVDRGRLGYNLPNLFNVVDFTLTQSLDMILQMMGRVLRISDKNKQKIYYKVATKNTAGYFVDLMTAALCLFEMEWYSKFNGKNMGGIQIPKVLTKSTKTKQNSTQSKNTKKPTQQLKSLEELGIPLDLNLFRQDIMYSQSDKFGTIAWTTLDECRKAFYNIENIPLSKQKLTEIANNAKSIKELGYQTIKTFEKRCISSGNWYGYDGKLFFDKITKHIPRQFVWNETEIRKDFKLNPPKSVSSYSHTLQAKKAKQLGIFDELTKNLPLGRIVWTTDMLLECAKKSKDYNDMISTNYGLRAYDKIKSMKDEVFSKKCFSHWKNYVSGRRFEWNKNTEHIFWEKVKETNCKTKQDLRDNNLRGPAQKLNLWNNFPDKEYSKEDLYQKYANKEKIEQSNLRKNKIIKSINKNTFTTNDARIKCNKFGLKNPFILLNDTNFVIKIGNGLYKKVKK